MGVTTVGTGEAGTVIAPSPVVEDAAAGFVPISQERLEAIWTEAAESIRAAVGDGTYGAWFAQIRPVSLDGSTLVLNVSNQFMKEWVESRYSELIRAATSESARRKVDVALVFDEVARDEPVIAEEEEVPVSGPRTSDRTVTESPFLTKYTFESFVIGASNRFAHAAALAVAEGPADTYNPLFIYGEAGLGKTHLLHAVGHYVRECHPQLVVRYVSTEQFMNDFILAIQSKTIPEFHRRYRSVDVLLVDDIQFLEGKERTQEEFFHTFNALHGKSQMVLTSDRPPKKISTLEERLRTRFAWGLITDIQPPDLETRLAILQRKSETESLPVPGEVMSFIASRIQTNIRELEGALIRVAAYASLTRSEVTLELAQNVLQSLLPESGNARVTSDLVISVAAEYFDVTPEEICSASRSRPLVDARQVAMFICRELTDLSLPKIGERFGGRDHSTVLHATRKIRNQMTESENCYQQVQELTTRIRQQAARG